MLKNQIARMSNRELTIATAKEVGKIVAIAAVTTIAFKVVVNVLAGPVEKTAE